MDRYTPEEKIRILEAEILDLEEFSRGSRGLSGVNKLRVCNSIEIEKKYKEIFALKSTYGLLEEETK